MKKIIYYKKYWLLFLLIVILFLSILYYILRNEYKKNLKLSLDFIRITKKLTEYSSQNCLINESETNDSQSNLEYHTFGYRMIQASNDAQFLLDAWKDDKNQERKVVLREIQRSINHINDSGRIFLECINNKEFTKLPEFKVKREAGEKQLFNTAVNLMNLIKISDEGEKKLINLINNMFKNEIIKFEEDSNIVLPTYIWGIIFLREELLGKDPSVSLMKK